MARAGHDLALVARRGDRLAALADDIATTGRPRPLVHSCDLANADEIERLVAWLSAENARVDILVNNAGFGLNGAARDIDRARQLELIDLNIRGLTDLTLRFLPQIAEARGRILNVASIAAFLPGPQMAVYYASKAYVLSFSEALSEELKGAGVRVCALCPGPTSSGFQARAGLDAGLFDRLRPMSPRDVAEAGYAGMMAGRRVIVPGFRNKASRIAVSLSPRALLLPIVKRLQESRKG